MNNFIERFRDKIFYCALFLLCMTYAFIAQNYDYDLWARLIAGMGFLQTGHVIKADFVSYTPTNTWVDHEWGSSVVFYFFQHYFGEISLVILTGLLLFLTFFMISKVVKLQTDRPYNFLFYFFALSVVINQLNHPIRCHLFSFLFFTVFLYILELAKRGKCKWLILLPFITILWNNLHGGIVSGIGLIFMYALGEALNHKPFKKYLIVGGVAVLAMLINPYGFEYIKFLLMANTMSRKDIVEWWGIFHKYYINNLWLFKFWALSMLGVEVVKVIKSKFDIKNLDWTKFIVLSVTLYLAVMHVKLLPFFVISATCFVYKDFYKSVENIKFSKNKDFWVYLLIFLFCLSSLWFSRKNLHVNFDRYPLQEVEFVKINELKGNLLSSFGAGSFISYKLYPDNKIFMDGRYEEVYPDYMLPVLGEISMARHNWKSLLATFPPDVIIMEKFYPVYNELEKTGWKKVFEGNLFGVFVPQKNVRTVYKQPSKNIDYYKKTLFNTKVRYN